MTFSNRWLRLFALGGIPLVLTAYAHNFIYLGIAWYCVIALLFVVDWIMLPAEDTIRVERIVDDKLSLGVSNPVEVRVRNHSNQELRIEVRDTPPSGMTIEPESPTAEFLIAAGGGRAAKYHLLPLARGDYDFGSVYARVHGRLGLALRLQSFDRRASVKVYPNLMDAAKFSLMARRGRLQQIGIRRARLQGAGRDFESLRDYMPDDELRRIDWKATARRGKLVARQYEVEKSQSILLVLDVGRTMVAEIDGIQKLDYAINAALLLAYVASLADDKVGLLVFADTVQTFIPPRQGRSQVYAILEALYNAEPSLAEPDYRGALAYLQARWRRRSLMVCFTDLWDPDSSRITINELAALQPRHLVAAVTLLDTKVIRASEQEIQDTRELYSRAVATQVLEDRQKAISALTQRGVLVVDSPADRLSAELVNRYLEIKERMQL